MTPKNEAGSAMALSKNTCFAAVIVSVFCAAANAEPSLILAVDEPNLTKNLSDMLSRSGLSSVLSVTSGADITSALAGASGDIVVLQKLVTPDIKAMNETLRLLGERGERATYVVFVEYADDFQWVGDLATPDNVKLATTVRSLDQLAVAEVYQSVGLAYDGADVGYDYVKAAEMALSQLDDSTGDGRPFALQEWETGVSTMFFDTPIMSSGAPKEAAATFVRKFEITRGDDYIPWKNALGVKQPPKLEGTQTDEWNMLLAEIVSGNCSGSERWDGLTKQAVSFQSFGVDLGQ